MLFKIIFYKEVLGFKKEFWSVEEIKMIIFKWFLYKIGKCWSKIKCFVMRLVM